MNKFYWTTIRSELQCVHLTSMTGKSTHSLLHIVRVTCRSTYYGVCTCVLMTFCDCYPLNHMIPLCQSASMCASGLSYLFNAISSVLCPRITVLLNKSPPNRNTVLLSFHHVSKGKRSLRFLKIYLGNTISL